MQGAAIVSAVEPEPPQRLTEAPIPEARQPWLREGVRCEAFTAPEWSGRGFVNVDINVERKLEVALPLDKVSPLLDDLEAQLKRFPKLRKLSRLAPNQYRWDMAVIGSKAANIAHEVSYAAHYTVDGKNTEVRFKPMPEHGNATLEGRLRLVDHGSTTQLAFEVRGRLRDVPVPLMYRLLAPAFIQGKFVRLVETYLEATRDAALAAAAKPVRRAKKVAS